jgi:hypothetical protein
VQAGVVSIEIGHSVSTAISRGNATFFVEKENFK